MIAVEIPTGFNTRSKKGHGNKHSFQCWTCSVGYFWSGWNNKFNNWQKLPWKQPEESQCGCQGGRVKGRKRHAKNATESAQVENPGNWKTGRAVLSLVLGLFCFYNGCDLVLSESNVRILVSPTGCIECSSLANYSLPSLDGCLESVLETLGTKTSTSYHVCFTSHWWPCAVDMSLEKMAVLIDNVHTSSEDHIFLHNVFWTCVFQRRGGDSKKDREELEMPLLILKRMKLDNKYTQTANHFCWWSWRCSGIRQDELAQDLRCLMEAGQSLWGFLARAWVHYVCEIQKCGRYLSIQRKGTYTKQL